PTNSAALAGQTFNFSVTDDQFPVGYGPFNVSVVASANGGACTIVQTKDNKNKLVNVAFPTGSTATVTENLTGQQNQFINGGSGNGTNVVQKKKIGSGINEIDFTNTAMGQFEICKDMDAASQIYNGTQFTFDWVSASDPTVKGTVNATAGNGCGLPV